MSKLTPSAGPTSSAPHGNSEESDNENLAINVVYILGPPGVGKGTLCGHTDVKALGWHHLSVGDYMRDLCSQGNDFPPEARAGLTVEDLSANMTRTKLLPAASMVEILRYKLKEERGKGHHNFIVDGFPRTLESAELFDEKVAKPLVVISACCDRQIAKERFLTRGREGTDNEAKFEARYARFIETKEAIDKRYEAQLRTVCTENSETSREQMLQILQGLEPPVISKS